MREMSLHESKAAATFSMTMFDGNDRQLTRVRTPTYTLTAPPTGNEIVS